jgi:hypothetical protein
MLNETQKNVKQNVTHVKRDTKNIVKITSVKTCKLQAGVAHIKLKI